MSTNDSVEDDIKNVLTNIQNLKETDPAKYIEVLKKLTDEVKSMTAAIV